MVDFSYLKFFYLKNRKFFFIVFSFFILVFGLFGALLLVKQRQIYEKKAATLTATLTFGATNFSNLKANDLVDTNIILDPGGQAVTAVDVLLDFPKEILELISVDPTQAKASTNFKTFVPMVSATDCSFNPNISNFNQTGRVNFGAVTFDCSADSGKGALTQAVSQIVNPLAWLHFKVKSGVTGGASGQIRFYYNPSEPTKDSNVVNENAEDILQLPTSQVSVVIAIPASPSPSPSPSQAASPTPTPSSNPTPTPSASPSSEPSVTPTPPPSAPPGKASLNFKIKFEGVDSQKPDKNVSVVLKIGSEEKSRFDSVKVTADQNGIYSGKIENLEAGTFDVYLKGPTHLQKKFTGITFTSGQNLEKDWTGQILLTGDADNSNVINIQDFLVLQQNYSQTAQNLPADFDSNGTVNIQDFRYLAQNYDKKGD